MMPNHLFPLLALILVSTATQAETRWIESADMRIEDGDTLEVRSAGNWDKFQLYGIDAPENRENPKFKVDLQRTGLQHETLLSLGIMASGHLRDLVKRSGRVELQYEAGDVDRYGRLQGWVRDVNGTSLNFTMVADGFAIVTLENGAPLAGQWRKAQQAALDGKQGLWGLLREPAMRWANLPAAGK